MKPHFGALFFTWLVGSLTAGVLSTIEGNVENLRGDGSLLGMLDATAGWLVFTAPISFFITGFFFLPLAIILEWKMFTSAPLYMGAGLLSVTLFITLFFGVSALPHSLTMLGLPAVFAGATWWFVAIRMRSVVSNSDLRID